MYVNVNLLALATDPNYFQTLSATNASSPSISFLVYNQSFVADVLGPNATGSKVAEETWQAFHEAGVYRPADNSLYIAANFRSLDDPTNVTVVSLDDFSVRSTHFPRLAQPNGATTYYPPGSDRSARPPLQVWTDEGDFTTPSQLLAVDPASNTSAPLLTSFLGGRNFSGLNDVRQHPLSGDLWFTDSDYGYFQHFRPAPAVPKQVYRFDPATGAVAAAADGFVECNGLEFSPDLRTLYVSDTGEQEFTGNYTRPATVYAFDVGPDRRTLSNRRLFAYVDNGSPDGIHTDTEGNLWGACGDGVHVWNRHGTLLGKIFIGEESNNLAFVPDGLLIFSNYRLWKVSGIRVQGREVCKDFGYCAKQVYGYT